MDREDELSRLRGCYESDKADMVVIFGRRRLGKTELVRESLEDRDDAVLYQATETTRQIQLDAFVDVATESFPGIDRIEGEWESLLGHLADQDAVIVLDEFPYLIDADGRLSSASIRYGNSSSTMTASWSARYPSNDSHPRSIRSIPGKDAAATSTNESSWICRVVSVAWYRTASSRSSSDSRTSSVFPRRRRPKITTMSASSDS